MVVGVHSTITDLNKNSGLIDIAENGFFTSKWRVRFTYTDCSRLLDMFITSFEIILECIFEKFLPNSWYRAFL